MCVNRQKTYKNIVVTKWREYFDKNYLNLTTHIKPYIGSVYGIKHTILHDGVVVGEVKKIPLLPIYFGYKLKVFFIIRAILKTTGVMIHKDTNMMVFKQGSEKEYCSKFIAYEHNILESSLSLITEKYTHNISVKRFENIIRYIITYLDIYLMNGDIDAQTKLG